MFRKNTQHLQSSFFDSTNLLNARQKKLLENSWSTTFRQEVFHQIPEETFSVLYSKGYSRPNAPINVMVGAEILKEGHGWSDETLEYEINFNLQVRYALGLDDIGSEVPTLRTIYNFRRRVREYAEKEGENLYETVFQQLTDKQLERLSIKTGWQRMDSTQLLSNIARLNRLELVMSVFQKGVKGLPKADQARWDKKGTIYLAHPAQRICYRLKKEEQEEHLKKLGGLLIELEQDLGKVGSKEVENLVKRVIQEQYHQINEEWEPLPSKEIKAHSLQSAHDPEATYRPKHGQGHKGYVTNISETCDPTNPVQLITSVETAPNTTDDGTLLSNAVDNMVDRGLEITEFTVDGGYNGDIAGACEQKHQFHLRPTTIRGSQASQDKLDWVDYKWHYDSQSVPYEVSCPSGQQVSLENGNQDGYFLARFDRELCQSCPLFNQACRVRPYTRKLPTLHVSAKSIRTARHRLGMSDQNYAVRANVEATIATLKSRFRRGKMAVRGLIRTQMVICYVALMVNVRRIHQLSLKEADVTAQFGSFSAYMATLMTFFFTHPAQIEPDRQFETQFIYSCVT